MSRKQNKLTPQEQHDLDSFRYKRRNVAVLKKVEKLCHLREIHGGHLKHLPSKLDQLHNDLSRLEKQFEKGKIDEVAYMWAKGVDENRIGMFRYHLEEDNKRVDTAISGYPDRYLMKSFIRGRQVPELTGDDVFTTIFNYRYEILADRDKYSKIIVTTWEAESNGTKWTADIDAYTLARCWEHKEFRFKDGDKEDLYICSFKGKLDSTNFLSLTALRRWTLIRERKYGMLSAAHLIQVDWRTLRDIRESIINEVKNDNDN